MDPDILLARMRQLIGTTGAYGLSPWLALAQAHWARDPEERRRWRDAAERNFLDLGAEAHAERLRRGEAPLQRLR